MLPCWMGEWKKKGLEEKEETEIGIWIAGSNLYKRNQSQAELHFYYVQLFTY